MSTMLDVGDVGEWTAEALDEFLSQDRCDRLDWRRFEIVDGVLVVSPPAEPSHETIAMYLGASLIAACPAAYAVCGAVRVPIGRSYRVTDVTVGRHEFLTNRRPIEVRSDILIAVEIESPSSVTTDRITKPAQYAAAGIAHYWRLETDPLRLTTYRLADGGYVESGTWAAGEVARITNPFPVEIDIASLLPG